MKNTFLPFFYKQKSFSENQVQVLYPNYAIALGLILLMSMMQCNVEPTEETLAEHVANFHLMEEGDHEAVRENLLIGVPHELNMADKAQYRYVLHRLREAGDHPDKSPALYTHLKSLHENGQAGPPKPLLTYSNTIESEGALMLGSSTQAAGGSPGPKSDINLLMDLYTEDNITYKAEGLSSIYNGVNHTTMQFSYYTKDAYTSNGDPFYQSQVFEAYGSQTEDFEKVISANTPNNQPTTDVVASLLITPDGMSPVAMALDNTNTASDICVTSPNFVEGQGPSTPCPVADGNNCINKGDQSGKTITLCYGRSNGNVPSDKSYCGHCNYSYTAPNGYPDSMPMMVSGTIAFPDAIVKDNNSAVGYFYMYLEDGNGGCFLHSKFDSTGLHSLATVPNFTLKDDKTLSFCFSGKDFNSKNNNQCITGANGKADFNMYVIVSCKGGQGVPYWAKARISSTNCKNKSGDWCAQIPEICIVQGCLAKGTMITLADGDKKAVESFLGGEMVKSVDQDRIVGATSVGVETIPMYLIQTANDKTVLVSSKHPIPTDKGMLLAMDLEVGMKVTTDEGPSEIAGIDMKMFEETVHNLVIGDQADAVEGKATMFADGILVGDLFSQHYYVQERKAKTFTLEELKKEVDENWHADLEHYFSNK